MGDDVLFRKTFETMAVWAGGWMVLRIVSYFIGATGLAVFGKGEHMKYLGSIVSLPVLSSALVLLLIYRYWRSFHWRTIFSFILYDVISHAVGAWLRYEQFVDIMQSANRNGRAGLTMDGKAPGLWELLLEPVLYNATGYILACLLIVLSLKKKESDFTEKEAEKEPAVAPNVSVLSVFCTFAVLSFVLGVLTTLARAGLAHFDVPMPASDLPNGFMYWFALGGLWTGFWFLIGGKVYKGWYAPVQIRTAIAASVIFSSSALVASFAPFALTHPDNLPFPWLAVLKMFGIATLQPMAQAFFFWVGARER